MRAVEEDIKVVQAADGRLKLAVLLPAAVTTTEDNR